MRNDVFTTESLELGTFIFLAVMLCAIVGAVVALIVYYSGDISAPASREVKARAWYYYILSLVPTLTFAWLCAHRSFRVGFVDHPTDIVLAPLLWSGVLFFVLFFVRTSSSGRSTGLQ